MTIQALVLAAGSSRRFGPQDKRLAPVTGRPMIAHVIDLVRGAGLSGVVVTAAEDDVAALARQAGMHGAVNPQAEQGQSTSLACGLEALDPATDTTLILLADMPWITPATLQALIEAASHHPRALALRPAYRDTPGHPVLLRRALFPDLMRLTGDTGARAVLSRLGPDLVTVPVDDPGILRDVDRPDDLPAPSNATGTPP